MPFGTVFVLQYVDREWGIVKIFISWSGEMSGSVAVHLKDWLTTVFEKIEPWISSENCTMGSRWYEELANQLENSSLGIICINHSNMNSPWLNFEAGAISKSVKNGKVIPLLFGLKPSELRGPLAQFTATTFDKDAIIKLTKEINNLAGNKVSDERLKKLVECSWPYLKKQIDSIQTTNSEPKLNREEAPTKTKRISQDSPLSTIEEEILLLLANSKEKTGLEFLSFNVIKNSFNLSKTKAKHSLSQLRKLKFAHRDGMDDWLIDEPGILYLHANNLL